MSARLHPHASLQGTSKASRPPRGGSSFEELRRALDGYFAKAAQSRKRLLEEPYDPKLLHGWRVSLRRITATLRDLARFSDDDLDDVRSYLRACREATGQTRDLDILVMETLPAFIGKEAAHAPAIEPLRQALAERQLQAHQQAVIALKQHPLGVPSRAWRHWAQSLEPPTDGMVRKLAAAAIQRRHDDLKKRAARLDGGQKRLHRFRTATKKLRYTIELYQPAFGKQATTPWLKQLADLQSHLGLAHDRLMARKLVLDAIAGDEAYTVKPLRRWAKRTADDAAKKALQSMARLEHLKPFWREHAH